jgi:serine/threonine-protein kinase RsbW
MQISTKIPSKIEVVPSFISSAITELKKEFPITDEEVFHVKLVLEEALLNAIKHGNKMREDRKVDISVALENNKLIIIIHDEGEGFNHEKVPDPTHEENIERTSGRGVYLMKQLMDEVTYFNGGRSVKIVKTLINTK